ncbi:hypothetical protein ACN6KF_006245 [Labrys sp. La1]|uniref:hypothetical protein n=1 Tax=Labrys sp. La1 TaxID=3404917 RepID=UPI003EB6BFDF
MTVVYGTRLLAGSDGNTVCNGRRAGLIPLFSHCGQMMIAMCEIALTGLIASCLVVTSYRQFEGEILVRKETLLDLIEGKSRARKVRRGIARRQHYFAVCIVATLAAALVTTAIAGVTAYQGQTTYWNHPAQKRASLAKS